MIERFEVARSQATSDFERKLWDRAIERGKITQAAYEEAFNRYRQCAEDAGIEENYSKRSDGTYKIEPGLTDASNKEIDEYMSTTGDCADKAGLTRVEALYITQMHNPNLLEDSRKITVQCLIKAGLVPGDYTVQDFDQDKTEIWKEAPYDPMTAEAQKCLQAGGYAVNIKN